MATFEEDLIVDGTCVADRFIFPLQSVGNTHFDPADPLGADKQEHQHPAVYTTDSLATVASGTFPLYQAMAAGKIHSVYAALVEANVGAATITIDIKKNGVTIIGTTFQLTNADDAFDRLDAGLAVTDYVADDFFEITVTATAGGGTIGKGLIVTMMVREQPS